MTVQAAKVGAQARQIKAAEVQPGPEEDASEEVGAPDGFQMVIFIYFAMEISRYL